jgi:hypothetical protein
MKLIIKAALLLLLVPVFVFVYFAIFEKHYFPHRYETAFQAYGISLLIALPGVLILVVHGLFALIRKKRD